MKKYIIEPIEPFLKDLKTLSKKYKHIEDDLNSFFENLSQNDIAGKKLKGFNAELYKVRLKSSDNNKGKSGGFRIIYEKEEDKLIIYLIEIYSKSQKSNINKAEIEKRLANK